MFEVGRYYAHKDYLGVIYKVNQVQGDFAWVSWKFSNGRVGRPEHNPYLWETARRSFVDFHETDEFGNRLPEHVIVNPEPEADAIAARDAEVNAFVYMAYTRSRNTNTVTIVSHVDEDRFNSMLRAHELQGFETLAKKRIKFTI